MLGICRTTNLSAITGSPHGGQTVSCGPLIAIFSSNAPQQRCHPMHKANADAHNSSYRPPIDPSLGLAPPTSYRLSPYLLLDPSWAFWKQSWIYFNCFQHKSFFFYLRRLPCWEPGIKLETHSSSDTASEGPSVYHPSTASLGLAVGAFLSQRFDLEEGATTVSIGKHSVGAQPLTTQPPAAQRLT